MCVTIEPQHTAGTVHDVGDGLDCLLTQLLARFFRRQRMNKAQPFLAILELVVEEMFIDQYPQGGAQLCREQQDSQHDDRTKQENNFGDSTPGAAVLAYHIASGAHGQQIDARTEQRRSMKHHAP